VKEVMMEKPPNTLPELEASEALLQKITGAKDKAKQFGVLPILDKFNPVVNENMRGFPEEAKFKVNGTKTWFQKYVMKPFEKFKIKIHALFKSIPERKTFEMYQQALKESADYVPPSSAHKRNNF